MRCVLIQSIEAVADYYQEIRQCVEDNQPKYSSHVMDGLLEWFTSFSSDENSSFAAKRGLNFLGRKSVLYSPFFILVYRENELVAFAPFFCFKVYFADSPASTEVISFCPDSTIFFYNDILVKDGCEAVVVRMVLKFFKQYNETLPYIVLFNHIPSTSTILPLLLRQSTDMTRHGFKVGISPVCWRGGLYPWNISSLLAILQTALLSDEHPEETRNNIRAAIDIITATSKTMLVFKKNHLSLKATIYGIFRESKPSGRLFELYNAVEAVFQSSPVKYPYITLPVSAEDFVNSLSSSKRYYFRRYRKQFLENGGSFIKLGADTITDQDIQDFISLHHERWGNSSNILNRMSSVFLLSFLQKMVSNGFLTLFFAAYEDRRIACLCCLDFKDRREFISSGRTLADEKMRAGKLLLFDAIIDSINEGHHLFDFGYGDEAYKSDYDLSHITNNVVALFHDVHPRQAADIFPSYEELML